MTPVALTTVSVCGFARTTGAAFGATGYFEPVRPNTTYATTIAATTARMNVSLRTTRSLEAHLVAVIS